MTINTNFNAYSFTANSLKSSQGQSTSFKGQDFDIQDRIHRLFSDTKELSFEEATDLIPDEDTATEALSTLYHAKTISRLNDAVANGMTEKGRMIATSLSNIFRAIAEAPKNN